MRRALTDLTHVIKELLQLAQASPIQQVAPERTDVIETIHEELAQYRDLIAKTGLSLTFHNVSLPVYAQIGSKDLRYIVQNLIENAIRYTPKDGSIAIGIEREPGYVWLQVKDTGIGIAQKDLARIFERFYRTEAAQLHSHGGTGLGLAIVRKKVEAYGGQISVDSTVGEGSVFRVRLPAASTKPLT